MTLDLAHLRRVANGAMDTSGAFTSYIDRLAAFERAADAATILALLDRLEAAEKAVSAAENLAIGVGMGWDTDGVLDYFREALATHAALTRESGE